MTSTYKISISFPKIKDKKTGKERSIKLEHRTVFIVNPKPIYSWDSGQYKIYTKNGKTFSISSIPSEMNGNRVTEWKEVGSVYKCLEKGLDYVGALKWLQGKVGEKKAIEYLTNLLLLEPS